MFNQYSYWERSDFQYYNVYWNWINSLDVLFITGLLLAKSHWRTLCRDCLTWPTPRNSLWSRKEGHNQCLCCRAL